MVSGAGLSIIFNTETVPQNGGSGVSACAQNNPKPYRFVHLGLELLHTAPVLSLCLTACPPLPLASSPALSRPLPFSLLFPQSPRPKAFWYQRPGGLFQRFALSHRVRPPVPGACRRS